MLDHDAVSELARLHQAELRQAMAARRIARPGRRSPRERTAALLLALAFRLAPSLTELVSQAAGVDLPLEAPRPA